MDKLLPVSITEFRAEGYRTRCIVKVDIVGRKSKAGRFLDRRERRLQQSYRLKIA